MSEIDVNKCQYYSKVDNCCHIFGNPLTATPCGYHKGCYYKQLQQLKQENEHLRSDNSMLLAQGDANAFVVSNLNFKIQKLQQCLDKIEDITEDTDSIVQNYETSYDLAQEILQKIKEVKGGNK